MIYNWRTEPILTELLTESIVTGSNTVANKGKISTKEITCLILSKAKIIH